MNEAASTRPPGDPTRDVVVTHWVHPEIRAYLARFARVRAPDAPGAVWGADRVLAETARADALITSMADTVDEAFLSACPRLRIVSATLKGYDNYDAEACTRHGVWLSILPDQLIGPTAELTLGLALGLLRNIRQGDAVVRRGGFAGWRPQLYGASLRDATVGIAGMGQLGRATAELLRPFGIARLLYHDARALEPADEARLLAERVDLASLLARSDLVLLLMPLTSSTRHLVDAAALGHARPGTYLVNVGRGSVVDEHAVLDALDTGRLAGYSADVFEMEDWALPGHPDQIPPALRSHPNTVFTPHLGSAVDSVRRDMSLTAARQVEQALDGRRPDHAVNSPVRRAGIGGPPHRA